MWKYLSVHSIHKGLLIDSTLLSINYLGKSLQVPIIVYTGEGIIDSDNSYVSEAKGPSLNIYPNPFSEITKIQFNLEASSNVHLRIFDVYGKNLFRIESLLNSGSHQLQFDASYLPSGIYLCNLIVNDAKVEAKMVVVK